MKWGSSWMGKWNPERLVFVLFCFVLMEERRLFPRGSGKWIMQKIENCCSNILEYGRRDGI